jgi:hypothetical protein
LRLGGIPRELEEGGGDGDAAGAGNVFLPASLGGVASLEGCCKAPRGVSGVLSLFPSAAYGEGGHRGLSRVPP